MKSSNRSNLEVLFLYAVIILMFSITFISLKCSYLIDLDVEPGPEPLDYRMMEIHYEKFGGWINTSILDIFKDGSVKAYLYAHASDYLLDSASTVLTTMERENFARIFRYYSYYENFYRPRIYYTDGDYHQVILNYQEEIPDTVTVYEPHEANIPISLMNIIDSLETLFSRMIK